MWYVVRRIQFASGVAMLAFMLCSCRAQAQQADHVEILGADRWVFDKDVATGAQRLLGNVRFRHAGATMSCDSAYLYEDERVTAFRRVVLIQGDTLRITGDHLDYTGAAQMARMSGGVMLSDPGMELSTEVLAYDLRNQVAVYTDHACITNRRDGSTLTSRKGKYHSAQRLFNFTDSVRIVHPEYSIASDTISYRTSNGMADFRGATTITQEEVLMYGERGNYDTRRGRGMLTRNGCISQGAQELRGDSLVYDRATDAGHGWGHVVITDTVNRMVVRGQEGHHQGSDGRSMFTGSAELALLLGADSLHLHADTLLASDDSLGRKEVTARRNVRFYRNDMQGVCDTMHYSARDSLITLRGSPFLWNQGNQLSGDTVNLQLHNGHAEKLLVRGRAFLTAQADSTHFDQITGTIITGYFSNNTLNRLLAEGNSRTVYFAREQQDSLVQVTGVNRVDCSIIAVGMDSGRVQTVSFLTQPDATLFPLEKAPVKELRLDGFRWNPAARPKDRTDIFRRTDPPPVPWGNKE